MSLGVLWLAILGSIAMGCGAACVFVFAVKRDYFRDLEDAKYQVFWSDAEAPAHHPLEEEHDGSSTRAR